MDGGPTVVSWVGARIVPLSRTVDLRSRTFQLRISARSAIDPPSNLERNSRSPVVRWTSSESPPFLPVPCRAYDLDLVSLSRSTYSIHGHRASRISDRLRRKDGCASPSFRLTGRPPLFFSVRSRWSVVVMKIRGAASCIVACPRGFWLMSRVHPRSQGYGCEQLVEGTVPRRG